MIEKITILPGKDKTRGNEGYDEIDLYPKDVISIVGPTGSGKTALITDLELLAQGDTLTGRIILINGKHPNDESRQDPMLKPVFMLSQNTKCFANMNVKSFIWLHMRARSLESENMVDELLDLANTFCGEKIYETDYVNLLSGGQTRALLIADAILISSTPIIMLDELENAGIHKKNVMDVIKQTNKILVFVTHDPYIILQSQKRIIMKNGAVQKIISCSSQEQAFFRFLREMEDYYADIREALRDGKSLRWDTNNSDNERKVKQSEVNCYSWPAICWENICD